MKGKEAAAAARRRVAELEAQAEQREAQHARQVAKLRGDATEREQVAQRHLSEVTSALRRDVEQGSSQRVRELDAEVEHLRGALKDAEALAERRQDVIVKVLAAFRSLLQSQGVTPHEAYERAFELAGLRPDPNQTIKHSSTGRSAPDPIATRRLERARGLRSAEWLDVPEGLDHIHGPDCNCVVTAGGRLVAAASYRGRHD